MKLDHGYELEYLDIADVGTIKFAYGFSKCFTKTNVSQTGGINDLLLKASICSQFSKGTKEYQQYIIWKQIQIQPVNQYINHLL